MVGPLRTAAIFRTGQAVSIYIYNNRARGSSQCRSLGAAAAAAARPPIGGGRRHRDASQPRHLPGAGAPPCNRRRATADASTSPADSERQRARRAVLTATKKRRSRSRPRDDKSQDHEPAPRVKPRLPPVPPTPKTRTRPKTSPFDVSGFEDVAVEDEPATTSAAQASAATNPAPQEDTDEENDPWWRAQASRQKGWHPAGAQSKRQAAMAWWKAASYSQSAGVRCRHCGKLCNHAGALRKHQENSSRCLQAQGWLSWSRTPCPHGCGRLIATGDAWALQQHLQHCPALSPAAPRQPPPTGRGT